MNYLMNLKPNEARNIFVIFVLGSLVVVYLKRSAAMQ